MRIEREEEEKKSVSLIGLAVNRKINLGFTS